MSLLGKWFVRVEVDKASVKRDLAQTRQMVVAEAEATKRAVNRAGSFSIVGADRANRAQALRAMQQLRAEQRAISTQSTETAVAVGLLGTRFDASGKSIAKFGAKLVGARAGLAAFGPAGLAVGVTLGSIIKLGNVLGTDYQIYGEFWDRFKKGAQDSTRSLSDLIVKWAEFRQGNYTTPDTFGPLVLPGTRHIKPGEQIGVGNADSIAAASRAKEELGLRIQRAEIAGDAEAVARLSKEMARLVEIEMVLNGVGKVHAALIRRMTVENVGLTLSVEKRTKAEELAQQQLEDNKRFLDSLVGIRGPIADATHNAAVEAWKASQSAPMRLMVDPAIHQQTLQIAQSTRRMFENLAKEYRENAATMEDVYRSAVMNVEGLFTDVLYAGITGNLEDIDDAFKAFLKNLAREIASFLAQQAVMKLLGSFAGVSTGGGTGGFISGSISGGGGFKAAPVSASSGLVKSPFGSMPSTTSAPAMAANNFQMAQTIVVVSDPSQYRTSPNEIITVVQADIARGGPIRNQIQRSFRR